MLVLLGKRKENAHNRIVKLNCVFGMPCCGNSSAIGHSIIRAALNRNVDDRPLNGHEQVQIVMLVIGHSMLDAIGLTCGSESYPVAHLYLEKV